MSNISNLVRKDFILLRRYLWIVALYVVGFSGMFSSNNPNLLYGLFPGMILILVVGSDMRLGNQQFLVTLPVKRSIIVLAKYVSSILALLLAEVVCFGVSFGISQIKSEIIVNDYIMMIGSLASVLLMMCIYLPLYYWLGVHGAQFLNIAMMVVVMLGNVAVSSIVEEENGLERIFSWINSHQAGSIALGISSLLLIIFISYLISLSIFKRKDL
ncbi:ABC-2 transporter permease [Paenibacillus sp. D2_2]|uniref:ABC-2 transporter permease n=1 Tax=Paenibacillus sp. D2_2 TaxID=3073092 RepID=UPI00281597BA|nr:ABC-2 transporter permease [Paenibacillus sp. D2_2]WMT39076.1 ABC-2 transporter permease [Paenibacillus sp. D2_2]